MKKSIKYLIVFLLLIALITRGIFWKENYNLTHQDEDEIVIRMAHVAAEDTPIHMTCIKFKEILEENSNNKFDVRVYPNSQLGGDRQNVESITLGYLTGGFPGAGVLAGFEPKFMVSDLPFVYKNREAAFQAFDNELGEELNSYLLDMGIHNMGFGETGYRYITSNKRPIKNPKDLDGIKIRTMENPIHIASFESWGANPTPMSFSEVFTGLQQGAIDAQENPLQITISSRFYEVQDTLSLTGHFFASGTFIIGEEFLNSLEPKYRELVLEAGREAIEYERELTFEKEKEYLEKAIDNGMKIVELSDAEKDVFINQASGVYQLFAEKYDGQDLIEKAMKYNN